MAAEEPDLKNTVPFQKLCHCLHVLLSYPVSLVKADSEMFKSLVAHMDTLRINDTKNEICLSPMPGLGEECGGPEKKEKKASFPESNQRGLSLGRLLKPS